ncbi:MAG: DNA-3-methyladenine glycosylase [Bacteroidetes bacterium]|jgi:DNA-3-methyladenine glycosylase I|nr:DNA-3-methyladenine glycosylase [Bacteroidota bacterium]MDF2453056.1 DNA-3-methyladenine glycosylase [Bacteroidota bacterium]
MNCTWPQNDPQLLDYHDNEWGTPVHEDKKHFEFLVLDCFQAGLSWKTILHRRKHFKKAFANFDVKKVAKFDEDKVAELMQNEGIIRNKLKITGTVKNAKAFMEVQKEFGSFDKYIWQFTDYKTIITKVKQPSDIRATSPESDEMSKALKKRGFTFVGSTICYAYMQAAGMVNDHLVTCSRYKEVMK